LKVCWRALIFFHSGVVGVIPKMDVCAVCNQPIRETVVMGRKLIPQVFTGSNGAMEIGRYLTVLNLTCACGERTVRRYENRPVIELKLA
jgi:hypothetical protein